MNPAECTAALEQLVARGPTSGQTNCTGAVECPRRYSLELVNCSAREVRPRNATAFRLQHQRARAICSRSKGVLPSGGWCLTPQIGAGRNCSGAQYDTGCIASVHATRSGDARRYFLPRMHFSPDGRVLSLLNALLRAEAGRPRPSLADIGAGVGQFCSSLLASDRNRACASYDGAGNVHEITQGFVQWMDLTTPLALPKAEWVLNVEVGEHVPNHLEPMLIRTAVSLTRGLERALGPPNSKLPACSPTW